MAAGLLAAGGKGKGYALPHARVLIHQPLGGFQGQATEVEIHAREILRIRRVINEILAFHTSQPLKKIEEDTERDFYMDSKEAKEYGIIDQVILGRTQDKTKEE